MDGVRFTLVTDEGGYLIRPRDVNSKTAPTVALRQRFAVIPGPKLRPSPARRLLDVGAHLVAFLILTAGAGATSGSKPACLTTMPCSKVTGRVEESSVSMTTSDAMLSTMSNRIAGLGSRSDPPGTTYQGQNYNDHGQNCTDRNYNCQGQNYEDQGQTYNNQGWNYNHQGQNYKDPGQNYNYQNYNHQGQNYNYQNYNHQGQNYKDPGQNYNYQYSHQGQN
ncbi:unnamed protein product [Lota lota]